MPVSPQCPLRAQDERHKRGQSPADLKRALAARFPHDIDGNIKGKDAVVKEIIHKAQSWRAG